MLQILLNTPGEFIKRQAPPPIACRGKRSCESARSAFVEATYMPLQEGIPLTLIRESWATNFPAKSLRLRQTIGVLASVPRSMKGIVKYTLQVTRPLPGNQPLGRNATRFGREF